MTEKAENELWLAGKFAEAYNRDYSTNYEVSLPGAECDSVDAYLRSASDGSKIDLQICMATTTERMREEAVQFRLQKKLRDRLSQLGYKDAWIYVNPERAPTMDDMSLWQDGMVQLIKAHFNRDSNFIEVKKGSRKFCACLVGISTKGYGNRASTPRWPMRIVMDF